MNWLLIVVLGIIVIMAFRGAIKGFLRLLFSFVAVVLLIGLVACTTPYISGYIQEHTALGTVISQHVAEKVQFSMESSIDTTVESQEQGLEAAGIQLPKVLQEVLFEKSVTAVEGAVAQSGIYQQIGDQLAGIVLGVISFVIALAAALIIVFIIGKITDLANKVPVVKGVNRFIGFWAGGFLGFIIVWIVFMLVGVMSGTELGQIMLEQIQKNAFLSALYNENLILKLLLQFFN